MNIDIPEDVIRLILELRSQLYTKESIVREVKKITKDRNLATQYVNEVLQKRKTLLSARNVNEKLQDAKSGLLTSGLTCAGCLIIGGIITSITYSMASPGGSYMATTGLFLVGIVSGVVAAWRLVQLLFYVAQKESINEVVHAPDHQHAGNDRKWGDLN